MQDRAPYAEQSEKYAELKKIEDDYVGSDLALRHRRLTGIEHECSLVVDGKKCEKLALNLTYSEAVGLHTHENRCLEHDHPLLKITGIAFTGWNDPFRGDHEL